MSQITKCLNSKYLVPGVDLWLFDEFLFAFSFRAIRFYGSLELYDGTPVRLDFLYYNGRRGRLKLVKIVT